LAGTFGPKLVRVTALAHGFTRRVDYAEADGRSSVKVLHNFTRGKNRYWKGDPMKTRFLFGLVLLIGITFAAASAQTVYVNSSPSANFPSYHTYAWGQQSNPNQIANSFLAQEAQSQINTQLQSKGLQMVQENQNPDLIVVGSGGMKTQTSYNAWGMRGIGGGMGGITPEQNVIGTLIVDLYDTKAKEMVWRGVAQGALNETNSQKNMKQVDKAVAKMFKNFPLPPK
jgi:Domain of unknown function (DUF4136)